MDLMRYGHDVWGEKVLNGVAWDLIPLAFWAGVAVIVLHLIYRAIGRNTARRRQSRTAQSAARAANNSSGS
jgi:ABC-type proline/glycine betaine transport system permease subunit